MSTRATWQAGKDRRPKTEDGRQKTAAPSTVDIGTTKYTHTPLSRLFSTRHHKRLIGVLQGRPPKPPAKYIPISSAI